MIDITYLSIGICYCGVQLYVFSYSFCVSYGYYHKRMTVMTAEPAEVTAVAAVTNAAVAEVAAVWL